MDDVKSYFWWAISDKDEKLQILNSAITKLKNDNSKRLEKNKFHYQLYRNSLISSTNLYDFGKYFDDTTIGNDEEDSLTLNVCKPICDTVVSKIGANKPRPRVMTEGGSWREYERAKKLTKFLDGTFTSTGFYKLAPRALMDACIFGTGFIKVYEDCFDIQLEKVLPMEILIDDKEAIHGEPFTMHQTKSMHKEILKGMFPGNDEKIEAVTASGEHNSNMIEVRESWKRAQKVEGKDGKVKIVKGERLISIKSVILHTSDYEDVTFPFIIFRWTKLPVGFFGAGIIEEIADIQIEMNDLLAIAQDSIHLTEIPKIFAEENSNVNPQHFDDELGTVIFYRGQTPPQVANTGATSQVLLNQIETLYKRMFEISGVSQLSAQSKKPGGLDSGVALREFNDIETERFYNAEKRYEDGFIDAAHMFIKIIKRIVDKGKEYKVKVSGTDFLKTIKWKEVDLEDDKYILDIFSSAFLPRTPAGKIAKVQELIQGGIIPPEEAMQLLDNPDLEAFSNLKHADINVIKYIIDEIAFSNKMVAPEPFMNLGLGISMVQRAYLDFKTKNLPEERQEKFRQWLEKANLMLNPQEAQGQDGAQAAEAEAALVGQAEQGEGALPAGISEADIGAASPII